MFDEEEPKKEKPKTRRPPDSALECLISWSKNICVAIIGFGDEKKNHVGAGALECLIPFGDLGDKKNSKQTILVRFPGGS